MARRVSILAAVLIVLVLAGLVRWRGRQHAAETSPPVGLAAAVLSNDDYHWVSSDTRHCRIHCREGSYAAGRVTSLEERAERSRARALELIGEKVYERPIDVFYVDSRDEMRDLVGSGVSGWTDWESSSVLLVYNADWRPFDQHEITHVISINTWGRPAPPEEWIREGFAVYADGMCAGYDVDDLARYMEREALLVEPDSLVHDFWGYNDLITYLQSGSFVGYLYEKFGVDRFRELWQRGTGEAEAIYGRPFAELERSWREEWLGESTDQEIDWETLLEKGCG